MSTMVVPATNATSRPTEFVILSWEAFALWWVVVAFIHSISCSYAACFAKFYWDFGATFLSYTLEGNNVGMPREDFHAISYVHIMLAAAHGVSLMLMAVGSLWKRTLVFFPWSETKYENLRMDVPNQESVASFHLNELNMTDSSLGGLGTGVVRSGKMIKAKFSYARGVVGVNGRYFYAALICREIVETAFQTAQAFRMSKYLSSRVLNNLYVSLLVVNCWSSAFVHARLFTGDEARRRLAVIVCDCVLDLLSAMGVTVIVVLKYVDQYDVSLEGFGYELQNADNWMAQMLNEARLVVVSSWSDLVGRVIFSMGIIVTTANMKKLLRRTPPARVADAKPRHSSSNQIQHLGSIGPLFSASSKGEPNSDKPQPRALETRFRCCSILFRHIRGRALSTFHLIFFVWGAVILALHLEASVKGPLITCNPKVNPMAGALPACYAVEFDCYKLDIMGLKEQVRAEWLRFDRSTAVKLHFLHCPALEIPEMLQEFSQLLEIWVYNSTIREWGASSAVTNSNHPALVSLTVVRTNMTDGYLPRGFQSADFPLGLTQLYFCETNLQFVPDDLDTKWRFGSSIYMENSRLTEVPLALARLFPAFLSFAGNPIVELQPELFEGMGIPYLILSRTKVRELPRNVTEPPSVQAFYDFSFTEIAFFWSWIDPFVELTFLPQISAGGSPYCTDLDKIFSGVATDFSVPFQPEYSRILMNSSDANWPALQQYVMCSNPLSSTQFPLEAWDAQYRIADHSK